MKKNLVAFLLLSSVFSIVFALLRTVPAAAQSDSTAPGTQPYSYSGGAPNTAGNAQNSDDDDTDCPCNRGDASEYPLSVTVDTGGNAVLLATTVTPTSDLPDLVPALLTSPTTNPLEVAPIYVDAYQKRGRLLYRFTAITVNQGGTLDVFQAGAGAPTQQVIWSGGNPPTQPDPNFFTPTPLATVEDRSSTGANMIYDYKAGHNHWHFAGVYTYALAGRPIAKVGFCFYDTAFSGAAKWFKPGYIGVGPNTWCAHGDPTATFIQMGISPGKADWYPAQVADQWIDITGLVPGDYTLTGAVNPFGYVDESDISNNTISQTRTIPGAIANAVALTARSGVRTTVNLSGSVVGPDIPARLSGSCKPTRKSTACYIMQASITQLAFAIASPPMHGTVSITSQSGLTATAKYTSNAGYVGNDSFTYTTTDTRNLTSLPARVQITVQ
jgi:Lysyl oxidase/Bacterial Ig domain